MFLRLVILHSTAGSTAKMMGGRNCQKNMNSHGWMFGRLDSGLRHSEKHFVAFSENKEPVRGGMYFSPFNQKHQREDYLGAEARAVIDADFQEIHPTPPRKNFIVQTREVWTWIKQRLQKA